MEAFQNLFDQLGFKGDINLVVKENKYEEIQFGENFSSFCEELGLEEKTVRDYLLKYALYEVYRESGNFTSEDLNILEDLGEEVVCGVTLGDILDEKYCISPESFYESFGFLLNYESNEIAESKEKERIIQCIQKTSRIRSKYFEYTPKEGTLFLVYKDKLKRHKQPFNKSADKLSLMKDIDKLKENSLFFLNQLGKVNNIKNNQDLDEFERTSNLLYIFNLYKYIDMNQAAFKNENKHDYYFNTLSSLIVIENIELKLYILQNLIEKEVLFTYKKFNFNLLLHRVNILSVLYPILIKEFVRQNLIINENNKNKSNINTDIINIADSEMEKIKWNAFVVDFLRNHKSYNLSNLVEAFEPIQVKNTKLFGNLYTRVASIQKMKREAIEQFKEDLYETVDTFNQQKSLSNDDILTVLEGYLIEMQKKIISKWRSVKKNKPLLPFQVVTVFQCYQEFH
ncbi:hypothetical protein [Bacillus velezensis]|uniref:hypothetical protein n=1 Tax=Bacillus velezensis TaxID=492670 RepID=UPI002176662E|nr:hypothetical protein [Bacillus velezensis]